jgi:ATP/maltotriose-dependent transcriptional regulator MalT
LGGWGAARQDMMLNPTIPDRTPILQFLEQLYELNNSDALAAFLSDPQHLLGDRLTLQSHIDRAYQNAAHTKALQTHLTQLQQISRSPTSPTIHLTPTSFIPTGLTARQSEILFHLIKGGTNETIGQALAIHPTTVKTHLKNICQKLNVNSRLAAVATALKQIGINSSIHDLS